MTASDKPVAFLQCVDTVLFAYFMLIEFPQRQTHTHTHRLCVRLPYGSR